MLERDLSRKGVTEVIDIEMSIRLESGRCAPGVTRESTPAIGDIPSASDDAGFEEGANQEGEALRPH